MVHHGKKIVRVFQLLTGPRHFVWVLFSIRLNGFHVLQGIEAPRWEIDLLVNFLPVPRFELKPLELDYHYFRKPPYLHLLGRFLVSAFFTASLDVLRFCELIQTLLEVLSVYLGFGH